MISKSPPPAGSPGGEEVEPEPRGGIEGAVVSGFTWTFISQIVSEGSRVVVAVILAHLLTPSEYGIAGMAFVFTGFLALFTDLALGSALVQRPTIDERDRSTAFWATLGLGIAATAVGIALSPLVADFFSEPEVQPLFAALSFGFTLNALSVVQTALLNRELAYRSLRIREIAGMLAGGVTAVVLAFAGAGPWAIIGSALAASTVSTVLLWLFSPWRPSAVFSVVRFRELGSFGLKVFGSRILAFLNLNFDNLLVGRVLGPASLGFYALAYNVMFTPMTRIALPVGQVLFPAYARMQADTARLSDAWLRSKRLTCALLGPAFLIIMVTAPDLVGVLFGEKWEDAVPVLQLLCLAGVGHTLVTLNWSLLTARGQVGTLLRINLVSTAVIVAAFAAGVTQGIVGVAACYAAAKWLLVLPDSWWTTRAVGFPPWPTLRAATATLPHAAAAAALAFAVRLLLVEFGVPAGVRLVAVGAIGVAVYGGLLLLAAPSLVTEVRAVLRRRAVVDATA